MISGAFELSSSSLLEPSPEPFVLAALARVVVGDAGSSVAARNGPVTS